MLSDEEPWEYRGSCNNYPQLDWFSADKDEKYDCRAICRSECPVRKECINTALNEFRIHGIWGGVDDYEIRRTLSVDADGKPSTRQRPPRCPYCLSRKLGIMGTRTAKGYETTCYNPDCGLTWYMAKIPAKLRGKKVA